MVLRFLPLPFLGEGSRACRWIKKATVLECTVADDQGS
jgi:hypothetical protein